MSKNQQSFLFQKAGMILNWFRRLCGVTPRKIVFKNKEFKKYLADVASCSTFRTTHQYVQHGNTSVLLHSIAVAYYSYYLSWYFHLNFRERELVRGALLHDYFLYDWHNSGEGHTFHAFTHARDAFVNAQKEFELSRIEREVIKKHMFPLTPVPPLCREGLMGCLVDKGCSLYETFKQNPYPMLRKKFLSSLPLAEPLDDFSSDR